MVSAPRSAMRSSLAAGAVEGTTTEHGTPRWRAIQAAPWAMLPAEAVSRPALVAPCGAAGEQHLADLGDDVVLGQLAGADGDHQVAGLRKRRLAAVGEHRGGGDRVGRQLADMGEAGADRVDVRAPRTSTGGPKRSPAHSASALAWASVRLHTRMRSSRRTEAIASRSLRAWVPAPTI